MVISHRHFTSLLDMATESRLRCRSLVSQAVDRLALKDYLLFEHGSASADGAGRACIDHMHLHIIPGASKALNCFEGELSRVDESSARTPYIFVEANGEARYYEAPGVPSQYGRRRIWNALGRSDWDWVVHSNHSDVRATIARWVAWRG